jgi:hypothetical protein
MTAAILSTSIDTRVALAKEGGGIKSTGSDEKQLLRQLIYPIILNDMTRRVITTFYQE